MALYYGKFEPGTMRNSSRLGYGEFLYVKIADEICNYVEQKKLNNGDKIPSERELSTMLSVSRNSVREAIRELESRGILKVHPGKGAFLVGNVEDRAILIQMKKKDFFELFEIKTVLERHIIEKLTPEIEEELLQELEQLALQMVALCEAGIFPQELDDMFHKRLLQAYQNQQLAAIIQNMIHTFAEYNKSYFDTGLGILNESGQSIFETIPLHLKLVGAMSKRDVKEALEAYDEITAIDTSIYSLVRG